MADNGKSIKTTATMPSETTTQLSGEPDSRFSRDDFFRDLKKVAKKQDRPSQRDEERR